MVEVLVTLALLAILSGVAYQLMAGTRTAVTDTKLHTDVVRLNQIISMYLGDGGSLDGLTTAQSVLEKLKTVRSNADAKRYVGGLTGRGVDVRLTAQMQSTSMAGTTRARAVWNPTTKRFDVSTTPGQAGVEDFVLDDALLTKVYNTETRTRSNAQYNDANGWVWSAGNYSAAAFLSPVNATLTLTENVFDPTTVPPSTTTSGSTTSGSTTSGSTTSGSTTSGSTTSGSTTSGSTTGGSTTSGSTTGSTTPTTLPKPINSPGGGTFNEANFPSTVTISTNGAPGSGSQLKYRINNGSWINYTGPISINPGDKVDSKNFTTNATLYNDSSTDSDTYYKLVQNFTGHTLNTWTNVGGGPNLTYTVSNGNPDKTTLSHGDTRLDLGGGEYLDAGVENTLTFNRQPFTNVPANTDFTMGEFIILNGTTFNDSEATSATLSMQVNLNQPAQQTSTISLNFTMVSTANTSDRLASADTVTLSNPTTSFTVTKDGVTYTLNVKLVNLDPDSGTVTGNTFYIYEGASARAALVGKWVSNK